MYIYIGIEVTNRHPCFVCRGPDSIPCQQTIDEVCDSSSPPVGAVCCRGGAAVREHGASNHRYRPHGGIQRYHKRISDLGFWISDLGYRILKASPLFDCLNQIGRFEAETAAEHGLLPRAYRVFFCGLYFSSRLVLWYRPDHIARRPILRPLPPPLRASPNRHTRCAH